MARKSIKRNYIYNLSYQILSIIAPFITTPYLSRVLGADGIGTVSFAESIVSYFVLIATLGLTSFGQREISYVQDSPVKRTTVFWETKLLECFTSFIVILVYIPFSMRLSNRVLYLILGMNLLSVVASVTWFFQGMEEFRLIVLRNTVIRVLNIVYIFTFVKTKQDIYYYVFGSAFFTLLSGVSLWFYLPRYLVKVDWKSLRPFRHFAAVLSLFIPTVAIQIYTVLDKTMIGLITKNAFENGYYAQAITISKMTLVLVTALGTVMIPRIGFHYAKNELETVRALMYRGYRFVWFLGIPLCFGLISIAPVFVPWFYGPGFEKVTPLLSILSFLILAIGINNVTGMQYLIPTKRQNLFSLTVIIGAVVNFGLNLILIYWFSSMGAAVASVIAETVIALVQLYFVRDELSAKVVFTSCSHYFLAGLLMLSILKLIGGKLAASIWNTLFMIAIGAAVYFLALFCMKDQFLFDNVRSTLNRVLKRE